MNRSPASLQSFRDSLPKNPDRLKKFGYVRTEEQTTDTSRWIWFKKRRRTFDAQHEIEITISYELSIGDAPHASYTENRDHLCNDVRVSFLRQRDGNDEDPRDRVTDEVLRVEICPSSFRQLENMMKAFCP